MRHHLATSALILSLNIVVSASHGTEAGLCTKIQDDNLRLACYDDLFRPGTAGTQTPPTTTLERDQEFGEELLPPRKLSNSSAKKSREMSSTVTEIGRRLRNELVIHLENQQIWVQTSPHHLSIKEGDNVIIRRGRMGGYMLNTERGGTTRVKRLR